MKDINRRSFIKNGIIATGTTLAVNPSIMLGCSDEQKSLKNIVIEEVDSNFEEEPLIRPLDLPVVL